MTTLKKLELKVSKVLEENKKSKLVIADNGKKYWIKIKKIKPDGTFIKWVEDYSKISDFWKDVDSRVGMDVCTPFIERFPGHSFVSFDNGLVWSKTMRRGFLLRKNTYGKLSSPKKMIGRPYGFGEDLSELDNTNL